LLQYGPIVFQILCEQVFLLADLGQQYTNLVRDIGYGIVIGCLAPVGELRCNGQALAASSLVGGDCIVLGFDEFV